MIRSALRSSLPPLFLGIVGGMLVVPTASAAAQERDRYDWAGEIAPGADLRIFSARGAINVAPAAGSTARVRAQVERDQGDAGIRFELLRDGDNVVICALPDEPGNRARCEQDGLRFSERRRGPNARADFTVELPRGVNVRLSTGGGNIELRDASGRVSASTGSGTLRVQGGEGEVRVSTGSGAVAVEGARGPVWASTGSGRITVRTAMGPVNASTGSGNIDVQMASLRGEGDLAFSSGSGTISLALPADFSAEVVATTGSGSLNTDFPLRVQGRMSSNRMSGTIGQGGRRLRISTGSGDIVLRRHGA